jgi:hypothetical protein
MEMATDTREPGAASRASPGNSTVGSDVGLLRATAIACGIGWAILFVVVGTYGKLQEYGDGSIFSYAVAVQDAWAFHWHNNSSRLTIYALCLLPAEAYIGLTDDARGGIAIYGFLFFSLQIFGLAATFAADRSNGRIIFVYACASTACLCPMVFGEPHETWASHALFWPALTICHYARAGIGAIALLFAVLLALIFTYEGALLFELAILATLLLRGLRDRALLRAAGAFLAVLAIWAIVKTTVRPDDYLASVLVRNALNVIDISIILSGDLIRLLLGSLAGYGMAFLILRRLAPAKAHLLAAAIVVAALSAHWLWLDHSLHTQDRYYLRTVLLVGTPGLGVLAALHALSTEDALQWRLAFLPRLMSALADGATVRAATGAILLLTLIYAVETAKFVRSWTEYRAAIRTLAMGSASDPELGDPRFVSSDRIAVELNKLSWNSTTPFLSVVVAPSFAPERIVVDPKANYFWLPCATAKSNENASRAIPVESRWLIRVHACLHRHG